MTEVRAVISSPSSTSQAATIAYTNPTAKVIGIDSSTESPHHAAISSTSTGFGGRRSAGAPVPAMAHQRGDDADGLPGDRAASRRGFAFLVARRIGLTGPQPKARGCLSDAADLLYDATLSDTFPHGARWGFTMADCQDTVERAGLAF